MAAISIMLLFQIIFITIINSSSHHRNFYKLLSPLWVKAALTPSLLAHMHILQVYEVRKRARNMNLNMQDIPLKQLGI